MAEEGLPKTTILKAIKEQLPADVRLGGDAADAILRCCNEFVLMVSATANEISEKQKRTTIMPDHVVAALEELGFGAYSEAVSAALAEFKESSKEAEDAKKSRKASRPGSNYTPEELLKMQQEMLAAAAERARALEQPLHTDDPGQEPLPPPPQQQQQPQPQPRQGEAAQLHQQQPSLDVGS